MIMIPHKAYIELGVEDVKRLRTTVLTTVGIVVIVTNDLPHEHACNEVDWLLQESYKKAVKLAGITDWSTASSRAQRTVEHYQLEIAKMLQKALYYKLG